ncbi:hypothetical protein GQ44DRAFT_752481 [Phaeosphaeriaceae sp. PMI808]|nr:hypothetical protein GQ44DRAFT_752481 [Phaeosphaeriaceae sp. PMI808]
MAITKLALLRLSAGFTLEDTALRAKLANAKKTMEDYTGFTFYFFQQFEDPAYIYVIGEWDSLDQHMNHFIPSQENQALLDDLKVELSVEWLQHIDVSHTELPLPKSDEERTKACRGELVISLVRHLIKSGKKENFQQTYEENKHHLQDALTEGTMGGGWRIDEDDDQKEWVLLCPYTSTDGFQKYGQIRRYIETVEIKHARLVDI